MSQSTQVNVGVIFKNAVDEGALSQAALAALDVPDLGAQIQAAMGTPADQVQASEVVLVTIELDDSGSIRFGSNEQVIRDGYNAILDALLATKQKDSIMVCVRYLNKGVVTPYVPLTQAPRLTAANYQASGGTPLYDQSVIALGGVLAKAQEFSSNGVPTRTVTVIVTDGADEGSVKSRPNDVATVVKDMQKAETHIICAMGINDGRTDFIKVFKSMGIDDQWILTPGNSPSEIRKAFAVVSQSVARASQVAGAAFSKAAMGGFANP